jgi:hypothetical protein
VVEVEVEYRVRDTRTLLVTLKRRGIDLDESVQLDAPTYGA